MVAILASVGTNSEQREQLLKNAPFRTSYVYASTLAASVHFSFDFSEGAGAVILMMRVAAKVALWV